MTPRSEFLMDLVIDVDEAVARGGKPLGERRVVNILGRTFAGPKLRGEVLAGAPTGSSRARTAPWTSMLTTRFETDAPYLAWLNRTPAAAVAERHARRVLLGAFKL